MTRHLAFATVVALGTLGSRPAAGQSDSLGGGTIAVVNLPAYTSSFIGIDGGTVSVAHCPAGRIVVGLAGSRLKFIQRLTPVCATVNKNGSLSSVGPVDPSAIAPNATGFTVQCPVGRVASGLWVSYHDNTTTYPFLGGLQLLCGSWTSDRWAIPAQPIPIGNYDAWPRKSSASCSQMTQPMRGLQVRATTSVTAVSIVCDEAY